MDDSAMADVSPMTHASDERCFHARMEVLPQLLACVHDACRDAGFAPPRILRVELAVEELFTNTVSHGYGGDCDRPVWIRIAHFPDGLCLIYQDAAAPFNPLACAVATGECPEHAGGQGIPLIRTLASRLDHVRSGDRNVLPLAFGAAAA